MIDSLVGNALYVAWEQCGFVRDEWRGWRSDNHDSKWAIREPLCRAFSWAIPSDEVLEWIAMRCPRIVEIGAGRGYWAKLLSDEGADVVAYDISINGGSMGENGWHQAGADHVPTLWFPVQRGGPEQAAAFPSRTLFLCWPPMTTMAAECLGHYSGNEVLYIGEGSGGCTADDDFWSAIMADWEVEHELEIPQWPYIDDYLTLFVRKS